MQEIVFGTTNPAKIIHVQTALLPLNIKVIPISYFGKFPDVTEDGKTVQENARKKALFYSSQINQPVLSMDNALFIDRLHPKEQPGMYLRRIPGFNHRPADEEMIDYYSKLFEKYGGRLSGHWEWALCIGYPDGQTKEVTAITKNRFFTSKVCAKRMPGYPLESLQIDPRTNKYVVEMTKEESDNFWQESIGKDLKKLFQDDL